MNVDRETAEAAAVKVVSIWRDDEHGCTSLEVVGGQKRYFRVWDGASMGEWGWVLNVSSRLVWKQS